MVVNSPVAPSVEVGVKGAPSQDPARVPVPTLPVLEVPATDLPERVSVSSAQTAEALATLHEDKPMTARVPGTDAAEREHLNDEPTEQEELQREAIMEDDSSDESIPATCDERGQVEDSVERNGEAEALERSLCTGRAVCVGVSSDVLEAAATSTALMGSPVISEAATADRDIGSALSAAASAVAGIVTESKAQAVGAVEAGEAEEQERRECAQDPVAERFDDRHDTGTLIASLRAEIQALKERGAAERRRADRAERALAVILGKGEEGGSGGQ